MKIIHQEDPKINKLKGQEKKVKKSWRDFPSQQMCKTQQRNKTVRH